MIEDVTSKKFFASKFFNYKMIDNRLPGKQYNKILYILNQFNQHNMKINEFIIISSIIVKLPPFSKDYKKSFKYSKDEINLEDFSQSFILKRNTSLLVLRNRLLHPLKLMLCKRGRA